MIESSEEMRMIEHLKRIMDNLDKYWHSIQLLLGFVSKPLVVDDRGLAHVLNEITKKMSFITHDISNLDLTNILGEIKYIGNRLKDIELEINHIKTEGFKKKIQIDLSCDGYEMVKKKNNYDLQIEEDHKINPDEAVIALLNTLTKREASVISHRLGLLGEKKKTWDAIGKVIEVTRERTRQIYSKGIRQLRHPQRSHLVDNITHINLMKEIRNG